MATVSVSLQSALGSTFFSFGWPTASKYC